jgi:hypothetical protein
VACSPSGSYIVSVGTDGKAWPSEMLSAQGERLVDMSHRRDKIGLPPGNVCWAPAIGGIGGGIIAMPAAHQYHDIVSSARVFDAEGVALWSVALPRRAGEVVVSQCLAIAPRSGYLALALEDGVLLLGTPSASGCALRKREASGEDGHPAEALGSLLRAAPSALSMLARDGGTLC